MAVVQGIREKVHLPLYDSLSIKPEEQLSAEEKTGTLKFFVNVQGKSKLETNLQSASLLPHYNTFEARAMRVVISDLPPQFPDDDKKDLAIVEEIDILDDNDLAFDSAGNVIPANANTAPVTATIEVTAHRLAKLYREAVENKEDGTVSVDVEDDSVTVVDDSGAEVGDAVYGIIASKGGAISLTRDDLDEMNESLRTKAIPKEQLDPNNGSGTVIGKLVYNTVTSLFVGEKVMISMPTWFFPAGAGPYSETGKFTTHGEPSPNATFRFAEPIYIDKQQNFRVEIEVPDSDVLKEIQKLYGPMNIWVVLDGYMTRDVQ